MFTNRTEFDRVEYSSVPVPDEVDSFELTEPVTPDIQFLDNLLKYRYNMGLKEAGMVVNNPDFRQSLITDLATATIDHDTQKLAARFRLSHYMIHNIRSQLTKLADDMYYADVMKDLPQSCWARFTLTDAYNAIPYVMTIMNALLSIISITLSFILCAKLWKLLP